MVEPNLNNSRQTQMSKILGEAMPSGDYSRGSTTLRSMLNMHDEEDEDNPDCTDAAFKIADPQARHRFAMILNDQEQSSHVRNIVNWPSSISYKLKALLGTLLSPGFMMQCLRLPSFAFFSLEALIFLAVILLPVMVIESVFYPLFRLLFGVLYPAYASFKAVRSKELKKYVSDGGICCFIVHF